MTVQVLHGDCRDVLRTLTDASVQCCVTSPPYYGLRDYGVDGQIGLEQTPAEFVAALVDVFREVRRVLRADGTVFLNLGDSYASGGNGPGSGKQLTNVGANMPPRRAPDGMKPKDLMMMPARVALALQADGWWLRSDIIWHKPNPMPESIADRPTSSHEHVFLLAKAERYFFDAEAVREEGTIHAGTLGAKGSEERFGAPGVNSRPPEYKVYSGTRNIRNVWTIATAPFAEAHFATFPPALAERCILAGTSERGCCAACGAPWVRVVERTFDHEEAGKIRERRNVSFDKSRNDPEFHQLSGIEKGRLLSRTDKGWAASCRCNAAVVPCTVLDPFGGAGTTGLVADRLRRDAVLIELNPDYAAMSRRRISGDAPLLAIVA